MKASTVVVATGARYRRLEVPILQSFEGRGVLGFADSGASVSERGSCSARRRQFGGPGRRVPAQIRKKILQRGRSGSATYFVRDPAHAPASSIDNIEVLTHTEVVALYGSREGQLERVLWRNNLAGKGTERPIRHVFLFIGGDSHWTTRISSRRDRTFPSATACRTTGLAVHCHWKPMCAAYSLPATYGPGRSNV